MFQKTIFYQRSRIASEAVRILQKPINSISTFSKPKANSFFNYSDRYSYFRFELKSFLLYIEAMLCQSIATLKSRERPQLDIW